MSVFVYVFRFICVIVYVCVCRFIYVIVCVWKRVERKAFHVQHPSEVGFLCVNCVTVCFLFLLSVVL